jgi:hypothetical protein
MKSFLSIVYFLAALMLNGSIAEASSTDTSLTGGSSPEAVIRALGRLSEALDADRSTSRNSVIAVNNLGSAVDILSTHADTLPATFRFSDVQVTYISAIAQRLCTYSLNATGFYVLSFYQFEAARERGSKVLERLQLGSNNVIKCHS